MGPRSDWINPQERRRGTRLVRRASSASFVRHADARGTRIDSQRNLLKVEMSTLCVKHRAISPRAGGKLMIYLR